MYDVVFFWCVFVPRKCLFDFNFMCCLVCVFNMLIIIIVVVLLLLLLSSSSFLAPRPRPRPRPRRRRRRRHHHHHNHHHHHHPKVLLAFLSRSSSIVDDVRSGYHTLNIWYSSLSISK